MNELNKANKVKKIKRLKKLRNNFFRLFLCTTFFWVCCNTPVLAKEAVGWHWYNEIYLEEIKDEIDKKDQNDQKNQKDAEIKKIKENKKTAMTQMLMLRNAVQEAKAKAILYPTVENMRAYLILQNFVTNQAALFTQAWKKALLAYPELDYSILHPTQNSAQHIIYAETNRKEKEAIRVFGEKFGLFFFYRGNNPLDQALAPIVSGFSKENNISLISVSTDGKLIDVFENKQINHGQAEKLGIKYFPALILVDPKNQKVIPIHYGFISDSELHRRFLQVATNFKEGV